MVFMNTMGKLALHTLLTFKMNVTVLILFSAPVFMPSPSVLPLSPYSLNVSWEKPEDNLARGEVMGYSISLIIEQRALLPYSQVLFLVTLSFS